MSGKIRCHGTEKFTSTILILVRTSHIYTKIFDVLGVYICTHQKFLTPIGVFGGFGQSPSEKRLASRVDNSSLPMGK